MKKIFKYLVYLLPWLLPNFIFKIDTSFYDTINKPFFFFFLIAFPIIWIIIYILIVIALYKNKYKNFVYYKSLIINYFSNQIYTFLFFSLKSPFIAFIDTIIVLISSLYLYNEIKSKYLIPYIIWNIFATVLSLSIYLINL